MNGLPTALQNILLADDPATRVALLAILLRELWAAQLDERAVYWAQDRYPQLTTATTVAALAAGLAPLLESTILVSPAWPICAAAPTEGGDEQ